MKIFFLIAVGLFLAAPVSATPRIKSPSLHPLPPAISLNYDVHMQAATRLANAHAHRHSQRHCWRAVKNALVNARVISSRPSTRYAKQAGYELQRKYAFKKLPIRDPHKAPLGAILVYGGRGPGHVEIRTQRGYVSDFANTRPSHRPLIGVYVSSKMIASNRTKSATRRS